MPQTQNIRDTALPPQGDVALHTPEKTRKELRAALGFDLVFAEEFKILKPYLGRISNRWPVQIGERVEQQSGSAGIFSSSDADQLHSLMQAYVAELRGGRFYEKFFASVENLAQFLVARNIPNSWLVGAFMDVFHDAQLEIFFDKETRQGRIVVAALRCLLKIVTLTIQIINRVTLIAAEPSQTPLGNSPPVLLSRTKGD